MVRKYYKSLTIDKRSWYDGTTEWVPGRPMPLLSGESGESCGTGYHFAKSIEQAVAYGKFPLSLWEARPLGDKLGEDTRKVWYTGGMIVREIPKPDWILRVERFMESLKSIKWLDNHGAVDPEWKMFPTRADAGYAAMPAPWAAKAAWDSAARDAKAALDAATRAAVRDAWDTWDIWDAAWAATEAAAWNAAATKAATWVAAGDAAWAATLMAQMEVCRDLKIPAKHRKYAKDRWSVWESGYGCLCDVGGTLYCYRRI